MERWALIRNGEVRGYLLYDEKTHGNLTIAKRNLVFGTEDDGTAPLGPEGEWKVVPESAGLVGDGWLYVNGEFKPRNYK